MNRWFFAPFALTAVTFVSLSAAAEYNEYCIVGAGPAGVQLGIFMEQKERDYVIFEKEAISGSFYVRYPRHRKLISINKRYTCDSDDEFNLRHDWNSLLVDTDKLLYKHYSEDYWPHADTMVTYLNDVAKHYDLKIRYGSFVTNVDRIELADGQEFTMQVSGVDWRCKHLVMASGLPLELPPDNLKPDQAHHWTTYQDMTLDLEEYRNKSVLIAGRGNAAFETAMHLEHVAGRILMVGRNRLRLAWETHYVGDLRAVNNQLLDAYLLKSHDAIMETDIFKWDIVSAPNNRKMVMSPDWYNKTSDEPDNGLNNVGPSGTLKEFGMNHPHRWKFDKFIRCTGWSHNFSTYTKQIEPERQHRKYPKMTKHYESTKAKGMYFAGTIAHSRDWRKSSGGFIHGFRYTVRALHKVLEWRNHGNRWPVEQTLEPTAAAITDAILYHNNRASGTYQMFGELRDIVILPHADEIENGEKALYVWEVPQELVVDVVKSYSNGTKLRRFVEVSLEYNPRYHGPEQDVFSTTRATNTPQRSEQSNFLHPFFRLYQQRTKGEAKAQPETRAKLCETFQGMEDLHADWANPFHHRKHALPFIERALNGTCAQRRSKVVREEEEKQNDLADRAFGKLVDMFRGRPEKLREIMLDKMPSHMLEGLVKQANDDNLVPTPAPQTCSTPSSEYTRLAP